MRQTEQPNIIRVLFFAILLIGLGHSAHAGTGVLMVNNISSVRSSAIANSSYIDGWQWVFDVTIPTNEPMLKLQFSNWFNGTNNINAGGNMRYYSQYSSNASNTSSAISISGADTYGASMVFSTSTDLDPLVDGIQTRVVVETKIPIGVSGSNYISTYGFKSSPITSESLLDFTNGSTASPSSYSMNADATSTVWSKTISVSNRPVRMLSLNLKKSGTVPDAALTNFVLSIDGVAVAVAASIDNSHNVFFDLTSSPYAINIGSHALSVSAVVGELAAGKNFRFTLQNSNDISVEDAAVPGSSVVSTSNGGNVAANLQSGNISVNTLAFVMAPDYKVNNVIIGGSQGVTLASFTAKAYNEPAHISNLIFLPIMNNLATTDSVTDVLTNVGLYINGTRVGITQTALNGNNLTFTGLSNSFAIAVGASTTIEIRGDLNNTNSIKYTAGNISFNLLAGSGNLYGEYSNQFINSPSLLGQSMIVRDNTAQAIVNPTYAAAVPSANTANYKIGSIIVSSGADDGASISSIRVALSGALLDNNKIANLYVKDNSDNVIGSFGNVSGINAFNTSVNLLQSESKILNIFVDIQNDATSTEDLITSISVQGRTTNGGVIFVLPYINTSNIVLP